MPSQNCAAHPGAAATFHCDGCGRLLCSACVEHGHRLIFCRHCRERALPLDASLPATVPELKRAAARARPTTWLEALRYPLRGQGSMVFWAYLGLMTAFVLVTVVPFAGVLVLCFRVVIALLMPGLLYAIVRRTAEGDDELPDWPDVGVAGERLYEVFTFLGTIAVAFVPAALALRLSGCALVDLLGAEGAASCRWAVAAGLLLGLPLAVPMFGSLAVYQHLDLLLRLDLHVRALVAAGKDGVGTVLLTYAVLAASRLLGFALYAFPLLGGALAAAVAAYGTFAGAHVVGLMFRKHAAALDAIYLPQGPART
ncbi:MAG TPA: B-box zinc finger protein [Thermoanaerobaculia bacterium]